MQKKLLKGLLGGELIERRLMDTEIGGEDFANLDNHENGSVSMFVKSKVQCTLRFLFIRAFSLRECFLSHILMALLRRGTCIHASSDFSFNISFP